jgi:hypothetical protein
MASSPQPPLAESRASLGLPELEQAIHALDSRALLVPQRILRRVIKQHAGIPGFGLRVPHRKSYILSRHDLLAIVEPAELDAVGPVVLADTVILLARPSPQAIATQPADALRVKYWRLLFHARVHLALEQSLAEDRFGPESARQRIAELGEAEFAEIRSVLGQEDFLLPPRDDFSTYVEFAAVYLELRYFARHLLPAYFPELRDIGRVDDIVGQDLDAAGLLAATRPAGAPDMAPRGELPGGAAPPLPRRAELSVSPRARRAAERLVEKAERVARSGNVVRAAILRTRAAQQLDGPNALAAREAAQDDLARLVQRLDAVCGFSTDDREEWSRALVPLLDDAARGVWPPEARLLYDLQKACLDQERGVYALNFWQWAYSLGQKPLKRPLPAERDVLVVKHLGEAAARLPATRIGERARRRLETLLETATQTVQGQLRKQFRGQIDSVLDRVRLVPANLPERVARQKMVDELVDRIVKQGFLAMGDLRDALSRNNLKLPDVDTVGFDRWVAGDQLLEIDRLLADELDGVYRSGEIYMRLPQRLSSLAFGTPLGRFLTRYVAIPFGGAYLALEGIYHLIQLLLWIFGVSGPQEHSHTVRGHYGSLTWWLTVAGLGIFLEAVLHHAGFRKACLEFAWAIGRLGRWLLVDCLAQLLHLPWVRAILASPYFRLAERYVIKPAFISSLLAALFWVAAGQIISAGWGTGLFLAVAVLVNSRLGRDVDELLTDLIVQTWYHIRIHIFSALFRFIVELFQRLLETIERLLYTVDEWLRFKAGERPGTTVCKVILTPVWRVLSYVIRIFVNLLIEPQINPIKHFPVVTVSHKCILPFLPLLTTILSGPLGPVWAKTIATPTIFLVPGVFGFLAWELKENWRLYAANRPRDLKPLLVGHHGERITEFLHPGFRSGTLPKIYARLRKSTRRSMHTGRLRSSARQTKQLAGVEEHLRRFVQRDFLMLLCASRGWHGDPLVCGEIQTGTNRILIELYAAEMRGPSVWISLEDQAGWLVASIDRRGWLDQLSPGQRGTLANALAGFYKLAGVDLVREQLDAHLPPETETYAIEQRGLAVRSVHDDHPEVVFAVADWPPAAAGAPPWPQESRYPKRQELIFSARPIAWNDWILAWQRDQTAGSVQPIPLADTHLLPGVE